MKTTDYILKYVNGDLSAFDKIYTAFESDVNEAIKTELKAINEKHPRDKEILQSKGSSTE